MRENIGLYRGKRIDNGEWVEGWYYKRIVHLNTFHQNVVVDAIEVYDGENPLSIAYYDVYPETVGQYTGLTDKNGKKIFEGDIVKGIFLFGEQILSVVKFSEGSFGLAWQRGNAEEFSPFTGMCNVEYEITGNCHDNPELLGAADG